jgi:IclR family transcriptional regulator, acetate operon repressor
MSSQTDECGVNLLRIAQQMLRDQQVYPRVGHLARLYCCAVSNDRPPRDAGVIRSVERAVAILDLLARDGWRAGAEVARDLGVHRSTALRLLSTLERHGLVERDPRNAKYRLGRRLPQLASVVTGEFDLRFVARPVCERLAGALGETVTLDVLDADEIVPIEQATGSTSVVSVNWLGRRTPLHCTASGKVILAFAPNALRQRLLARPLERRTPHTIVDRAELEEQLAVALETGFARTFQELEVGLDAIAAPVHSADGAVVAAIDVSGPAHRLKEGDRPELVGLTREAAADLSRRLGYRGPAAKN